MPSKSKAQRNFMAAAAHNPAFAKKVGIPAKVAKEFNQADKGKKFVGGGMATKHEDIKMDKKTVKKAVGMHDKQLHGGKKTDLSKLKSVRLPRRPRTGPPLQRPWRRVAGCWHPCRGQCVWYVLLRS